MGRVFLLAVVALATSMSVMTAALGAPLVIDAPGVYVLDADILDCSDTRGILIAASDVTLDGNGHTLDGIGQLATYGVFVFNPSGVLTNVTVKNLAVTDWSIGIFYQETAGGTIVGNTIEANTLMGIYLNECAGIAVEDNAVISNATYGTHFWAASGNTVAGNTFSGHLIGVDLRASSNGNTIAHNTVTSNEYGVWLVDSGDNTIYDNWFENVHPLGYAGTLYANEWNVAKQPGTSIAGGRYLGGNFWADPDGTGFSETGTDADSDGICDAPYALAAGNIDYLPLFLGPQTQLANLTGFIVDAIASDGIASEMQASLLAKVDAAMAALAHGNPNDVTVAMNDLKALVKQVQAQTDKKIDPATAAEIIRRANQVIAALGG